MGIFKLSHAGDHLDPVSRHMSSDHLDLRADHLMAAMDQIIDGDLMVSRIAFPVEARARDAGQLLYRLITFYRLITWRPKSKVDIAKLLADARQAQTAGMYEEAERLFQLV